jgi:hypothetical protein
VKPAQLPPVDPDFLIVERDQKKLDAYARGLLAHLRRIRSGQTAQGYPIATIKSAAVWLINLLLQVAGQIVLVHPLHDQNDARRLLVVGSRKQG